VVATTYPVNVTVTPSAQAVPQASQAAYTITLSLASPAPSDLAYVLGLSGLVSGTDYQFSPSMVTIATGGSTATSTLTLQTTNLPGLYCPGSYAFTVTANNATTHALLGQSSATISVTQVGPPLTVSVYTDKATYRVGDKVTISISVNRPAEGQLVITPPGQSPTVIPVLTYSPTYSTVRTLTANAVGRWQVVLQADDFCSVSNSATAYFDVTPDTYSVSISLSNVPSSVSVGIQVDGQNQGTMNGTDIKTLQFKIDTQHSISVDQYVDGGPGVRYFTTQNTWNVGSAGSHTFDYRAQYLLTVATDPNGVTQVTGGGWYDSGSSVQTNQVPQTLAGAAGTQYAFKDWDVDGVAQSGNPITVTMNGPHTATAKYVTQYQLLLDSPYGNPQGSGYYDAGSTASFSVTSPEGVLVQQVFVQWTGDYSGTSPQGSITMDKPKVVHAVWRTDYTQLIVAIVAAIIIIAAALFLLRRRHAAPVTETKPTPPETEQPTGTEEPPAESPPAESPADTVKCGSCGADVPTTQSYCQNCGAKMN
jgi:hypothetical protein